MRVSRKWSREGVRSDRRCAAYVSAGDALLNLIGHLISASRLIALLAVLAPLFRYESPFDPKTTRSLIVGQVGADSADVLDLWVLFG